MKRCRCLLPLPTLGKQQQNSRIDEILLRRQPYKWGNQNYDPDSGQQNSEQQQWVSNDEWGCCFVLQFTSTGRRRRRRQQKAAGSKQRQQQRRQAQVGVVGGNCWSTRRVFGELTKQAQAIERRHTLTQAPWEYVPYTHTHILLFIHLCVWWPVWNCCCCKRFYANYKIHRPGMLVFSLSLSLSLSLWNVCCFCVACIKGNPIDIYVDA